MSIYGYARVSTERQSIDRQIRNIEKEFPDVSCIYAEHWTGTDMSRPEWKKLLRRVESGDIIVFDSVSRMSRNAEEGVSEYFGLMDKNIGLVFLKEPHIDTETYKKALLAVVLPDVKTGQKNTDKFVGTILDAITDFMRSLVSQQIEQAFEQSEKEVRDLRQRTKEGLEIARSSGKTLGRPTGSGHTVITKKEKKYLPLIKKMSKDFDGSMIDSECIRALGIARGTYYKYKKKLKEGQ